MPSYSTESIADIFSPSKSSRGGEEPAELLKQFTFRHFDKILMAIILLVAIAGTYVFEEKSVVLADNASLLDFALNRADGDGIVKVVNTPNNSITAGLPAEDYAYLNSPYWFSSLGNGVNSAMYIKDDENFFVSGYWSGWSSSGARGKPVVIHSESGPGNITLLGISPTFGAHPKNMFRVLANAIFTSLDCE